LASLGSNAFVYRLNKNGSLDATFDGDGVAVLDSGAIDQALALTVQRDGKIVVAGTRNGVDALVYRLSSQGSLDTTFGRGGVVTIDSGRAEFAQGVAVQPDGKIVVTGFSTAAVSDAVVYRLTPAGALDSTFGRGGTVTIDDGGNEAGEAVAVQAD